MEVIMKRSLLFFTAFALMIWLGCENAKSPTSPENLNPTENEAALEDTLTEAPSPASQDQSLQKAKRTIKVPGHYHTIQAAVDAANPGEKIVVNASGSPYNEVVFITKPDIQITANGAVTLNGNFAVAADGVKISHFNINVLVPPGPGLDGGISIGAVSGVEISHNTITGVGRGIFLNGSTSCLIKKNTCTGVDFGIGLYFNTNNNIITQNTCTGNASGISIIGSDNNKVIDNDCSSNRERGLEVTNGSDGNVIQNNVCNQNRDFGIVINYSDGNVIKNNTCNQNRDFGIAITLGSKQNKIGVGNTANFNGQNGVFLSGDTSNNTVTKNDFHCNAFGDIVDNGAGNTIVKNSTGPLPECQ
jgi:parallel beta-helix repeat protein